MHTIKTLFLFLMILIFPAVALAEGPEPNPPHWSVEVKGGLFYPDIDNWSTYYGTNHMWHVAGSVGYKLLRQVELGVEAGMMRDHGQASAPINGIMTGNVEYSLWPLNVYATYRAVFSERQWLVPYVGGGWTRIYYREKVEAQQTIRGNADGYHGRAGIQLLLDDLDTSASNNLYLDFGINHTYLVFEVQYSRVMVDTVSATNNPSSSVNIGGTSYLGGFLFEF